MGRSGIKYFLLLLSLKQYSTDAFTPASLHKIDGSSILRNIDALSASSSSSSEENFLDDGSICRRDVFRLASAASVSVAASCTPLISNAVTPATAKDGLLPDLPPEAVRSYLQYRIPLQISADYYLWELQELMEEPSNWGDVGQLFQVNNNKGQGQPSRIERDYVNPMRILALSMPPDTADEMRDSQFKFEKAMAKITKVTSGIRRDLPVEIDSKAVPTAKAGWEEGRVALNSFFKTLNDVTGLNELKPVPGAGPNQNSAYGRSKKRYFELAKKTKLCQNRGGPILSQTWGQLMVTGYLQDSCGIPDLDAYFYQ